MNSNIKDILFKLVSVQSDTGTVKEVDMANCIYDIIKEHEYFKENSELCGKYYNNDLLNRPVVWALHKGKSNRTIVLTGHYDAVEIDSYGNIKEYALNPDELKEKLKLINIGSDAKKDLENPDWYFARGINDMKAGIAINLDAVISNINEDVNVLFVAVHDEENLSAGMRQSAKLFCELKEKFGLDYKLILITEPHIREQEDKFKVFTGTVGKIMPAIVSKGKIAHGSDVMRGLNSTILMSQIITNLELNPDLCSTDKGMTTPPPTVLFARDLKEKYDVSVPEYSTVYLNYQFLKIKSPIQILNEIKVICKKSFDSVIDKYNLAYDVLYKKGSQDWKIKRTYKSLVYSFDEIDKIAEKNNTDYLVLKKELYEKTYKLVSNNKMTIQDAGIFIIKGIIELSMITDPLIVVGFIPPYYPSTNNSYLQNNDEKYVNLIEKTLADNYGLKLEKENYFMGICDGSYTSCTDRIHEEEVMKNMVTSKELYDIPFDDIEQITAPFIVIGPWGKDYHTIRERVYMKDVEITVPYIIRKLINII